MSQLRTSNASTSNALPHVVWNTSHFGSFSHTSATVRHRGVSSTPILDYIGRDKLERIKIPKNFIIYTLSLPHELSQGQLVEIRDLLDQWARWDALQSLAGYHSGMKTLFGILKDTVKEHCPESSHAIAQGMFECLYGDVCALQEQLLLILRERGTYKSLLACRDDLAQQLLDLLQDLLDAFPQSPTRPRLSKALLALSRSSGLHPTCFTLTGMEKVGEQVAGGAFGDVWKGLVGGQSVSVKIMRLFKSEEVKAALQIKDFGREAVIWRQLSHPNVLTFYGLYYLERRLCLVSPWMENGHVLQFLRHAPPDTDRVSLMLDIATGLEYLHGESVVHGDLKGMNILVTPSRRACVADFGLSSIADAMTLKFTHSTASARGGTPRYMAPELLTSTEPANHFESDVFAFACVCYEMLTGKPPYFNIPRDVTVILMVPQGLRPTRPDTIRADDSLWLLLEKCWEAEPEDRPTVAQIIQHLVGPTIGAKFSQAAIDWDESFSAKFRRSLQEWPLLPSVSAIEREIFGDDVAQACLDCFPERRQATMPAIVQDYDPDWWMALNSPTISSPTLSEVGWHPSSIMSPIIEYAFGHEPTVPAHPLFQSGWIPAACLANHYVPITSDDRPPQMCEVFVSTHDLHVHHAPFHNLPLLPQPDHSVWDAQRRSPPPDEFFSTDFFSVSENYISMLANDPVMAGEPAAQNLFASLEPSHLSAEPRRGSVSSPDPYLTSPMDTPYDDFASTPDESPLSDFSLLTPVHNDDDVLVSTLVADGRYDSQLPLFGGVFESTQPTTPPRKPTNALSSRFREPPYEFSGSSSPLLPSVVVTPPSSSRALPPASPRPDPGLPVSEAFDARPDVFDDSRAASHLVPSILLSPSPPAPNLPRSRRGRDATGVKHPIGDTLDPFISTNFKRRRTGS